MSLSGVFVIGGGGLFLLLIGITVTVPASLGSAAAFFGDAAVNARGDTKAG